MSYFRSHRFCLCLCKDCSLSNERDPHLQRWQRERTWRGRRSRSPWPGRTRGRRQRRWTRRAWQLFGISSSTAAGIRARTERVWIKVQGSGWFTGEFVSLELQDECWTTIQTAGGKKTSGTSQHRFIKHAVLVLGSPRGSLCIRSNRASHEPPRSRSGNSWRKTSSSTSPGKSTQRRRNECVNQNKNRTERDHFSVRAF